MSLLAPWKLGHQRKFLILRESLLDAYGFAES
jgi:hypothetical protein